MALMRYLAIDLGDKRTGLALGDDITRIVSPLTTLEVPRGERLIAAILKVVASHQPGALVIGLPLNMDGSEGPAAQGSRDFGALLEERSRLPIHFQDERLSSYAADGRMARSDRTHRQKKQLRDALAAAEVLRDFLGVA